MKQKIIARNKKFDCNSHNRTVETNGCEEFTPAGGLYFKDQLQ